MGILTSSRKVWLEAECGAFAAALRERTGWEPLLVFGLTLSDAGDVVEAGLIHAVLRNPAGGYVDADGAVDESQIARRHGFSRVDFEPCEGEDSLREVFGFDAATLASARRAILSYALNGDRFFETALGMERAEPAMELPLFATEPVEADASLLATTEAPGPGRAKRQPMAQWLHKLDLQAAFDPPAAGPDGEYTAEEWAQKEARVIRALEGTVGWWDSNVVTDLCVREELEAGFRGVRTVGAFDEAARLLYDQADLARVWVETGRFERGLNFERETAGERAL